MTPATPSQALSLGRSIYLAFSAIQRWMDRTQHRRPAVDLSPTDVWLLGRISATGPVRMSELATWQDVDRSTMSVQVGRLSRRGLVKREPDPQDRRAVAVTISETGAAVLEGYENEVVEVLTNLLRTWAGDDLTELSQLLGRLAATIDDDEAATSSGAV